MAKSMYSVRLPDGTLFNLGTYEDLAWLMANYYGKDPEVTRFIDYFSNVDQNFNKMVKKWQSEQAAYENASGDPNDIYGELGRQGLTPSGSTEKWLDNEIGQSNAQTDRDYQTGMRDTSLLSTAEQLQKLGLGASNVIQVGGASSGVQSQPAAQTMHSAAAMKQQKEINAYNQRMAMARGVLGMVGQMASSGIYGGAIAAAKHSASVLAGATAHSGLKALGVMSKHSGAGNGSLLSGKLGEEWSKLPGAY